MRGLQGVLSQAYCCEHIRVCGNVRIPMNEDNSALVLSLHVGAFPNFAGDMFALIKVLLSDNNTDLILIQAKFLPKLLEHINRSINEKSYQCIQFAEDGPDHAQPKVQKQDFDKVDGSRQIKSWQWHVFDDHVEVTFTLADDSRKSYILQAHVCFVLREYLQAMIDNDHVLGLERFVKLSLEEMEADLTNSKGYQLSCRLEHFDLSIDLFQKNYNELTAHLDECCGRITNPNLVTHIRRYSKDLYMYETLRLLHNFLASCFSLVDHSRKLYKELYQKESRFPEYKEEVKKVFASDPLSQFVKDLRIFLLHYRLPSISFTTRLPELEGAIFLHKDDLEEFPNWSACAKEFLTGNDDKIDLRRVIEDYHEKVELFQRWFRRKQQELHRNELDETARKRMFLQACHAKSVVERLRNDVAEYRRNPIPHKLLELFIPVLSAKDYHDLKRLEAHPNQWLEKAVDRATDNYPLPEGLERELRELLD